MLEVWIFCIGEYIFPDILFHVLYIRVIWGFTLFLYIDDIIKEQRKLKKKTQKIKTQQTQKKGVRQQQGKQQTRGAAANQKQRKRIGGKQNGQSVQQRQGTQDHRRPIAGKQRAQQKQATQGQRRAIGGKSQGRGGGGNQNVKRNTIAGNKGRFGGAKVTANRLKNKQGSLQRVGWFSVFGHVFFLAFIFLVIRHCRGAFKFEHD